MAPPLWAYQVENFVNEPDEEFVCSICRAIFCDPVVCPCDHVFCRMCIAKWLQNNRNCPICRKRVSNSSVKPMVPIIKNLIMKLVLYCRNKTFGCKGQFSLESCESHMKECQYELVQCKNKPCKERLFRKDIIEHETTDCPHRYVKCPKCGSKMPTSAVPENHDCIRALQLRIRRKNNTIRKKNKKIEDLKSENIALKASSQNSRGHLSSSATRNFGMHPLTSSTLTSLSPDEIMINIAELESSSLSSDSDDSSENSIIIFTNSQLDHSDDNPESESLSGYIDTRDDNVEYDNIEYSQNDENSSEYRNVQSQTADDFSVNQQNEFLYDRNQSPSHENDSMGVEAPESVNDEDDRRSLPRRPIKRRPTTQKPAKRRLPPPSPASSDDDESRPVPASVRSSKRCWRLPSAESNQEESYNISMEAGPSSASVPFGDCNVPVPETSSSTKGHLRSKPKAEQKPVSQRSNIASGNVGVNLKSVVPSGNAVFERTLALLEQYNLESDPEWLPEYASHQGDTVTESDSSIEADYIDDSSSSDTSESDSNNENYSNMSHAGTDFMHWMFESTSEEDDPDWQPINFTQND